MQRGLTGDSPPRLARPSGSPKAGAVAWTSSRLQPGFSTVAAVACLAPGGWNQVALLKRFWIRKELAS